MNLPTKQTSILLTSVAFLGSCHTNPVRETPASPNIILIMADDVAPEHFGCYGGQLPTPNIDEIASKGMVFNRAYAASAACTPSRYSVMTGQFPGRCASEEFTSSDLPGEPYKISWNTPVVEENTTLHEVLNEADYFTGYVGKFHIGDLDFDNPKQNPDIPVFEKGIDPNSPECEKLLKKHQSAMIKRVKELTGADFAASIQWENPETLPIPETQYHNLEWLTQGVYEFLQETTEGQPFFLHLNTTAYHGPNHHNSLLADPHYTPGGKMENPYRYHPPRSRIFDRLLDMGIDTGSSVPDHIRHYNTGILYLDDQIGAITNMLRESNKMDNTLIIITADHAIEPGKSTCYERGVRVPFIAFWADRIEPGSVSNEMIHFTDFLPTFANLANTSLPENLQYDGTDFSPVLFNQSLDREFIYFEEGYTRAISNEKYKYIAMRFPGFVIDSLDNGKSEVITHFGPGIQAHGLIASRYHEGYFSSDQLYDLEKDPWEQNNLAALPEYKQVLDEMKLALNEILSGLDPDFNLEDTSYINKPAYIGQVKNTLETGLSAISWWNRKLDYPPDYYPVARE